MKILGWMLIRMVAARFVAILLGISVLVLSLDLLSNAKDVQALAPGHATILLKYMLWRAPAVRAPATFETSERALNAPTARTR